MGEAKVTIGEITVVTTAPSEIEIPEWLAKRNIFANGAKPAATSMAPFLPNPKDPAGGVKRVPLYDINFLGKRFAPSAYFARTEDGAGDLVTEEVTDKKGVTKTVPKRFVAQGVGETLAKKLLEAQESIYREFARFRKHTGDPISESAFDQWCGLRAASGGYDFRNGSHFGGSAIDINAASSPYTATRTFKGATAAEGIFGGEDFTKKTYKSPSGKQLGPITLEVLTRLVWRPAVQAYDHAMAFALGDGRTADVSHYQTDNPGESHQEMDSRFQNVSGALIQYFGFAYNLRSKTPKSLGDKEVHEPVPLEEFKQRCLSAWNDEPDEPESFQKHHPSWAGPMKSGQDAFLEGLYKQVVADHEALCLAMVHGTLLFDGDEGDPDPSNAKLIKPSKAVLPKGGSRDPCYGFIDIRSDIVVALCDVTQIRWGGCMFGTSFNGDMMHFDLGYKKWPDLQDDPNPEHLWYVKSDKEPAVGKK
jgi:hypothetical protein